MESILSTLFHGEYDITPTRDQKQQEIRDQIFAELEKVEEVFGAEFLDHLLELDCEHEDWKYLQYYRSGVQLGVRLTLEALAP